MSTRFNTTVSRRNLLAAAVTAPLMTRAAHAARGDRAATPGHAVIIGDDRLNGSMCWTDIAAAVGLDAQWRCTVLSAENGDLDSLRGQIDGIPGDATRLVLSIGRQELRRIESQSFDVTDTFTRLVTVGERFAAFYSAAVEAALTAACPLAVCTLMGERNMSAFERRIAAVSLTIANDAITREALRHDLPLLDLRLADEALGCTEPAVS